MVGCPMSALEDASGVLGVTPASRGLVSEDFARRLVAQAREEGLDVTGDSGLLQQRMKSVLEAALAEELTDHLGYEPGDPAGRGSGNSRNGSTPKRLLTEAGPGGAGDSTGPGGDLRAAYRG